MRIACALRRRLQETVFDSDDIQRLDDRGGSARARPILGDFKRAGQQRPHRRLTVGAVVGWAGRKAATTSIEAFIFTLLVSGLAGPSLGTLVCGFVSSLLVSAGAGLGVGGPLRLTVVRARAGQEQVGERRGLARTPRGRVR
jgi:hypothetical protein